MMSGIRGRNTKPEKIVRSGLHKLGFRFRLHGKNLLGKPDVILPKWNAVIFVSGCFWHGHDCPLFKKPETHSEFWEKKIGRNRSRDVFVREGLRVQGWRQLTIWECALRGTGRLGAERVVELAVDWLKGSDPLMELRGLLDASHRPH